MREFYNEKRNESKDHHDRYRNCKVLVDKETNDVLLATREIINIPLKSSDTYHRVKVNETSRLDILAHQYYKNPLLWWVIAQANDIYDPMSPVEPGTLLRIPAIESLYGFDGVLL